MLDTETKRRIDAARDTLVGKVPDPKSQVEQITVALIYKFMDDMDKESISFGGKATFFTGKYKPFSWTNLFNPKIGGAERYALYEEGLKKLPLHPDKSFPNFFRKIFEGAKVPYTDVETLNMFLKIINDFTYDHSEKLGDAFEYLLSILGSQGDAGQFRTPRHIIDFIVEVLQPKKTETILDPACGTAGFLISSYKHILKNNSKFKIKNSKLTAGAIDNSNLVIDLTPQERKNLMQNFVGYDISPDMVRLSLVNMYLHGFITPNIYEYDTLTSEDRWSEYFDVILANPPFMTPKGGIKPHKKFTIQANRSEVLFVDYIAEHIHPSTGRAGIIVPEGIIFQSATAYKALRKMLVEKNMLYAVVSLPAGIFNPYSGVKTSILLMDKTLAKKTGNILFVKIESDGFDLGAQRRAIDKNDLTGCLELLQQYKYALQDNKSFESDNKNVFLVEKTKIAENADYNLSIDRYRVNENVKTSNFEMVRLGDESIFKIESGGTPDTKNETFWNGNICWATLVDLPQTDFISEIKTTERKITEAGLKNSSARIVPPNSILVSSRATIGRIGINRIELATNQGFKIIVIKNFERAIPEFVALMMTMLKEEMEKLASGGTFKEISKTNFCNLQIPLPPLSIQQQIVSKIESYQKIIDGAKQVTENYKPQIDIDASWEMVKLGEVCEIKSGGTPSRDKEEYWNGNIPWIKTGQINFNRIFEAEEFITKEGLENSSTRMIEKGTILMAMYGQGITRGRVGVLEIDATINQAVAAIIIKSKNLNKEYLFQILISKYEYLRSISDARGGNQSNLNSQMIKEVEIPLPPISIQQEIVKRIEEEQALVNSNKKLIAIFEQKIKDEINKLWLLPAIASAKAGSKPKEYAIPNEKLSIAAEE